MDFIQLVIAVYIVVTARSCYGRGQALRRIHAMAARVGKFPKDIVQPVLSKPVSVKRVMNSVMNAPIWIFANRSGNSQWMNAGLIIKVSG
jgi:hypothetical protein